MQSDNITYPLIQQISDIVGDLVGWDFSKVRAEYEPPPWTHLGIVKSYLKPTDHVLDIGTGGGEIFLSLASQFKSGVAIDHSKRQVATALANRATHGIDNVDILHMEAAALDFPVASFDLVLNSHCGVYPEPIARVLRPGGYFITEQVGRRQDDHLLTAFGWNADSFGPNWWWSIGEAIQHFTSLDCRVVARGKYDRRYWLQDLESLVFYLKARPMPEDFDAAQHWQAVKTIVERHTTPQGIESNEHMELLIVQKGESIQ